VQRRDILRTLALALVAPLAHAQATGKVYRVGVLVLANWENLYPGLIKALGEQGYVEGSNLKIEFRSADGKIDLLPELAAELVRLKVDLLVPFFATPTLAASRATSSIPIVAFAAADLIGSGLVASLARPGGNVTGILAQASEATVKCLELMREIKPAIRRTGVLFNAPDPSHKLFLEVLQNAAPALGLELFPAPVSGEGHYQAAFAAWGKARVDSVVVQANLPLRRAAELAMQRRLPSAASIQAFPRQGGLLALTVNIPDLNQRAASLIDKLLKGAKPADLPVELATRFDLTLNRKTANALGLAIPQSVLLRVGEVIE
jgi:putative ABC transport system substrate-binding protein